MRLASCRKNRQSGCFGLKCPYCRRYVQQNCYVVSGVGYTLRVFRTPLLSLFILTLTSAMPCLGQSQGVQVHKLPLNKNPQVSRGCQSDFAGVWWVDDTTILVRYLLGARCRQAAVPFLWGNTMLDMEGRTIASIDRSSETGVLWPGPNGGALAVSSKHSVQILDRQLTVLKTIDYEGGGTCCSVFLSADCTGFAICSVIPDQNCRYLRGEPASETSRDNFPGGFPELDKLNKQPQQNSTKDRPEQYLVKGDESWFFDRKGNVFRVKPGMQAVKLPSPTATLLDSGCVAVVSEENPDRLLASCYDELSLEDELPLYAHERLVLYDVPSGRVLFKLDPGVGNSTFKLSPDGKRIAVVRGAAFGGRASITIYYVP